MALAKALKESRPPGLTKSVGLIFRGVLMPKLRDGSKTRTMRLVSRSNSLVDGHAANRELWARLNFAEAWVDLGPSPAGNAGPYLQVPWKTATDSGVARVYPRVWAGDRIWSRETFGYVSPHEGHAPIAECRVEYRANLTPGCTDYPGEWPAEYAHGSDDAPKWRSPLHQPRSAARFVSPPLVRVFPQRPQSLTDAECLAEGTSPGEISSLHDMWEGLWVAIHGDKSWLENPWCWVYDWGTP